MQNYNKVLEYFKGMVTRLASLDESSQINYEEYMDYIEVVFKAQAFEIALEMYILLEDNISNTKYAAQCHNNIGICHVALGHPKKDIFNSFMRAVKLDSDEVEYASNLALSTQDDLDPSYYTCSKRETKSKAKPVIDATLRAIRLSAKRIEVDAKEIDRDDLSPELYDRVTHIDLSYKNLEELPFWLEKLVNLISLDISHNKISKDAKFKYLSKNLRYLNISHNEIKRIGTDFLGYENLEYLDISHNSLIDIPLLLQTHELIYLDLSNNKLDKLKNGFIDDIPNLKYFNISNNKLKTLPKAMLDKNLMDTDTYKDDYKDTYKNYILKQSISDQEISFEDKSGFDIISHFEGSDLYDFERCHDFQLSSDTSEFLDYWLSEKPTEKEKKSFKVFAQTGDGGYFAYWKYNYLVLDPPIVYFGSDGAYNMIAANEDDLTCLLATGQRMDAENSDEEVWKSSYWDSHIDDILEDGEYDTFDDVKKAFYDDIDEYAKLVKTKYKLQDSKVYIENMKRHPSFNKWVETRELVFSAQPTSYNKAFTGISSTTQVLLGILESWGDSNKVYSLYDFHDMEVVGSFGKSDCVEEWFKDDFYDKGNDFLEFAINRAGDSYALWVYPELKGEPAVVFLDGDGDVELLAPSMGEFLALLTNEDVLLGNVEDDVLYWYELYTCQYDDIVEENEEFEDTDEVEDAIKKEIKTLNAKVKKAYNYPELLNIIKNYNRHPDFKKWFDQNVNY